MGTIALAWLVPGSLYLARECFLVLLKSHVCQPWAKQALPLYTWLTCIIIVIAVTVLCVHTA